VWSSQRREDHRTDRRGPPARRTPRDGASPRRGAEWPPRRIAWVCAFALAPCGTQGRLEGSLESSRETDLQGPPLRPRTEAEGRGEGTAREKKCPRRPAAAITALSAATCGVLTRFMGFRPTDLGHGKSYRWGAGTSTESRTEPDPRARPPTVLHEGVSCRRQSRQAPSTCSTKAGAPRRNHTATASNRSVLPTVGFDDRHARATSAISRRFFHVIASRGWPY